jgi:site-specific DNA-methyltransferase (adenine-specific)
LNWLHEIAKLSYSILKDDGSFFLNIGGSHLDLTLPFDIANEFKDADYHLQNKIHWIKSISIEKEDVGKGNGIRDDYSVGHFKPLTSERFLTDLQEYIFHIVFLSIIQDNMARYIRQFHLTHLEQFLKTRQTS